MPPYTQPGNPYFELVSAATVDFLDGTLKGHPDRLDRIAADVAAHPDIAQPGALSNEPASTDGIDPAADAGWC